MKCRLLSRENLIGRLLSCRAAARLRPMLGQSHDALETGMTGGASLVPRDPRGSLVDSIATAGNQVSNAIEG